MSGEGRQHFHEELNRLNREIFQLAIVIGEDPDTREWAMHMTMVARALERVGDNAVDIGEVTAFVVTGLFREFSDSSAPTLYSQSFATHTGTLKTRGAPLADRGRRLSRVGRRGGDGPRLAAVGSRAVGGHRADLQ